MSGIRSGAVSVPEGSVCVSSMENPLVYTYYPLHNPVLAKFFHFFLHKTLRAGDNAVMGWNEAMAAYLNGEEPNYGWDRYIADYATQQGNMPDATKAGFVSDMVKRAIVRKAMSAHKIQPSHVFEAMKITLLPFGIQAMVHGAKETKKMVEDEVNGLARQITYPEGLINEAVNRHLSKF
jgi:hypothetical protein